jgi:hypothetical protein
MRLPPVLCCLGVDKNPQFVDKFVDKSTSFEHKRGATAESSHNLNPK